MGLGFTIFCSVSSDNFFVLIYTFLSLVLTFDFCYSQLIFSCILFKKDKKIKWVKNSWNILKNLWNSFKKGEGVPLLNFEGGPGVPLLNFRGVHGPTLQLWYGSRVPGFWSYFYTMPNWEWSEHDVYNIVDVVLVFLLLTLNIFHSFF